MVKSLDDDTYTVSLDDGGLVLFDASHGQVDDEALRHIAVVRTGNTVAAVGTVAAVDFVCDGTELTYDSLTSRQKDVEAFLHQRYGATISLNEQMWRCASLVVRVELTCTSWLDGTRLVVTTDEAMEGLLNPDSQLPRLLKDVSDGSIRQRVAELLDAVAPHSR